MTEDFVTYNKAEWEFIYARKPELRPSNKQRTKPSLDSIIVQFLEKYEVFVRPVTSKTNKRGDAAVAGAITGAFGADVGGDAFIVSGQNKQTQVQEWTQWKQWALDHKDFPAFKEEVLARFEEENKGQQIMKDPLSDPAIRKEIAELIEGRKTTFKFVLLVIGGILIALYFANAQ